MLIYLEVLQQISMKLRTRNNDIFSRQKQHIYSLTPLLDRKLVPLPAQSIKRVIFTRQLSNKNQQNHFHKRTFSQQEILRNTTDKMKSVRLKILSSLRKTSYPTQSEQLQKLRTAGMGHQKFHSLQFRRQSFGSLQKQIFPKPGNYASISSLSHHSHNSVKNIRRYKIQQSLKSNFDPHDQINNHKFLRKGSDINRKVVANILKIKLQKKKQLLDPKAQNQEIIKMIRLYKGCQQKLIQSQLQKKQSKQLEQHIENQGGPLQNKVIISKSIVGRKEKSENDEDKYLPFKQ